MRGSDARAAGRAAEPAPRLARQRLADVDAEQRRDVVAEQPVVAELVDRLERRQDALAGQVAHLDGLLEHLVDGRVTFDARAEPYVQRVAEIATEAGERWPRLPHGASRATAVRGDGRASGVRGQQRRGRTGAGSGRVGG